MYTRPAFFLWWRLDLKMSFSTSTPQHTSVEHHGSFLGTDRMPSSSRGPDLPKLDYNNPMLLPGVCFRDQHLIQNWGNQYKAFLWPPGKARHHDCPIRRKHRAPAKEAFGHLEAAGGHLAIARQTSFQLNQMLSKAKRRYKKKWGFQRTFWAVKLS